MSDNLYDGLSQERKELQEQGLIPDWYTTGGWQLFKSKYLYATDKAVKGQFERISKTAAKHMPKEVQKQAEKKFFELFWKGWLSPSTPVLSNMGTDRGMPVSCSGSNVADSIDGFYLNLHETACLTKNGFGTSAYLGDIRARGTPISVGGKASGVLPVFKEHVQMARNVAQGTARRGAWAGYLPIDHGDFDEIADHTMAEPDDTNVGWVVSNAFIDRLDAQDPDAIRRFQKAMKMKMITGKGYFFFNDKVNANRPEAYVKNNLIVKASNLCTEITLASDDDHTFTCVLSSMNIAKYDEWKDTDAVYWAIAFLDCVASEFIDKAKDKAGLEKAVRFTQKGRALGLGACGLHTYFQSKNIAFESFEAHMLNIEIFKNIFDHANDATKKLAIDLGEPEWCKGTGRRNTHLIAIAPTKQTALLMGGISEGIAPDPAMTFTQLTASGEVERLNPTLLNIMKERNQNTKKNMKLINEAQGSVQGVDWLSDEEKLVFKTAFEINQDAIIRLASARAPFIDQWQSLNLFFSAEEDPAVIAAIHKKAFKDPAILALYYCYSKSGVEAASGECIACQ